MAYNESYLTQACVAWFRMQYPQYRDVLIHPSNEGKREPKLIPTKTGYRWVSTGGKRLKAEGLVAGVSDLLLLIPRNGYGSLGIEMKYGKNKQQDSQKSWQKEYEKAGNKYEVCYSIEEFIRIITDYLE